MATIKRENIGNLHDKVTVQLTKEDYLPSFEKSLKAYAKNANIPGFRKGMVPAGMLRKMYGASVFQEEVLRTAGRQIDEYIQNEKVPIFAQPMVMQNEEPMQLDMTKPEDYSFDFEIGLRPEVSLDHLTNAAPFPRYKVEISDKLLQDEIERMQKKYGTLEDLIAVADDEDMLSVTFIRTNEQGEPNVGAEPKEAQLALSQFPEALRVQLIGKEATATVNFVPNEVCTAEELPNFVSNVLKADELANDGHFTLTLNKVSKLVPKELDVNLFAEIFPQDNITTEEVFRERLKEDISKEFDRIAQDRLNNEIFEFLVHKTPIELPADFLKRWLKDGQEKRKTDQEVAEEFPGFEHQLRWTLISDKILTDQNISVSKEDVIAEMKTRLLSYFGMEADEEAPWMADYIAKMQQDEKAMDETYRKLLNEKLFSHLHGTLPITEQAISEEAFFKLQDAHAAHH